MANVKLPMFYSVLLTVLLACTGTKPVVAGDSTGTVNKDKLLELINDARKKGCKCGNTYYAPVPALTWNDQLEKAAYNHSKDMSAKKYFSHDSPSGTTPGDRIKTAGYKWRAYAENIGQGYDDEEAMVKGWLRSPGHCSNIMGKNFKEVGVANVNGYWTADFAAK